MVHENNLFFNIEEYTNYIYIYTQTCQLRPPLGLFKMALMDKWS